MEVAWLVEKTDGDRPYWLTAYLGQLTFSADANDAIRFVREQDASAVAVELFSDQAVTATEHQWV